MEAHIYDDINLEKDLVLQKLKKQMTQHRRPTYVTKDEDYIKANINH